MKYSTAVADEILHLKSNGYSSREIANILKVSKSGVNDFLNKNTSNVSKGDGARILFLDTETAAAIAMAFGRFKVNLSQDNIVQDGGNILCAAWKWQHNDTVEGFSVTPEEAIAGDDLNLVSMLYSLYEQADAVVAHNLSGFDHKMIQTRSIYHGFGPLPTVKLIDTLTIAKKTLRLPSNKLDSIGEYFNLGRKIDTGGISLWKRVQQGCPIAMQEMLTYCKQDVTLLENVYYQLRSLGHQGTNFNAGHYHSDKDSIRCSVCGSTDLTITGRSVYTALSEFKEYQCNDCGALHRNRQTLSNKTSRKSLVLPAN